MAVDDSSSFRELDDVFLQSQARIWLGEVLRTRFGEQLNISDLLSDGELLFEVAKEIWKILLVKYMELNNFKAHMFIPVDTRKSSGRYRPYSNVDSFLKVCKVLGLSGVDLFSPSDVVEKRDTRKVCICIRSLSKKARSKQLNVPDFDIVTKTVAMPTDVVGCIRRSLELSTCGVTRSQSKDTRLKFRQKSSVAAHRQKDESCPEESDEAKSNFSETRSYSSCADTSCMESLSLESGESPDSVDRYALTQGVLQSGGPGNSRLDNISSPFHGSRLITCDEFTPLIRGVKFWHHKGEPDQTDISPEMGENSLTLQNSGEVDHLISLSEMISFRILTNVPFHTSEDCLCHSCMVTEAHDSNTTPKTSMCRVWRKFPDDVDASSTSSVSSVVGRVLDFDFDAKSAPDDLRTSISFTRDLQQLEAKSLSKVSVMCNEFQESPSETKLELYDLSAESSSPCCDNSISYFSVDQDFESLNQIRWTQKDSGDPLLLVKDNFKIVADNAQETMLSKEASNKLIKGVNVADQKLTYKHSDGICNDCLAVESSEKCHHLIQHQSVVLWEVCRKGFGDVDKEDDQLCTNQSDIVHRYAEGRTKVASKVERKDDEIDCLAEAKTHGRNHKTVNTQKQPTHIAPVLKTVAKGTTLIGILFLLHLRNKSDRNINGKAAEKSSQVHWKSSGVGLSTRKGEEGSKIYPVEKFKFGD